MAGYQLNNSLILMKNRLASQSLLTLAALVALGTGVGVAALANAQTVDNASTTTSTSTTTPQGHRMGHFGGMHGKGQGVMGTVSAVNGNTITVTGKNGTSYTVDGSSATVSKMVNISVGDIKVGDTIGAQGTVSGNSVTANHIMDGIPTLNSTTTTQP